ncbi:hypothetical protein MKW98_025360 [Papaver atlanticum]|uniref:Uncharacterized protein n=1 Tax=Papaver atlanticum TaxID=357466 RepID=A0AAD4XYS1_9MAGN|nr:hypothetical protein MKW98_025360 [Papaver atlanticum]
MEEGDCADLCAYTRVDADYCGERKVKFDPVEDAKRVAYWRDRCAGIISNSKSILGITEEKPSNMIQQDKLKAERERAAARKIQDDKLKIERKRVAAGIALEKTRREQQIAKSKAAAEIASRKSRDAKLQRERDRAASRMALEEMERTAVIYNSLDIMRDYQRLICSTELYEQMGWPIVNSISTI